MFNKKLLVCMAVVAVAVGYAYHSTTSIVASPSSEVRVVSQEECSDCKKGTADFFNDKVMAPFEPEVNESIEEE